MVDYGVLSMVHYWSCTEDHVNCRDLFWLIMPFKVLQGYTWDLIGYTVDYFLFSLIFKMAFIDLCRFANN